MRRFQDLGKEELRDFLVMPSTVSSGFRVERPAPDVIRWEWEQGQCFAYRGMRQLGFLNGYRCGVIYRIECWLEALGMACETSPPVTTCIMHTTGACAGEFRVSFTGLEGGP